LAAVAAELPRDADIVVYCHHGVRSAHAVAFLRAAGIAARNMTGGIDRWSVEVDPSVRRY
jgi:rhodanese-related sulfurtransferase